MNMDYSILVSLLGAVFTGWFLYEASTNVPTKVLVAGFFLLGVIRRYLIPGGYWVGVILLLALSAGIGIYRELRGIGSPRN